MMYVGTLKLIADFIEREKKRYHPHLRNNFISCANFDNGNEMNDEGDE